MSMAAWANTSAYRPARSSSSSVGRAASRAAPTSGVSERVVDARVGVDPREAPHGELVVALRDVADERRVVGRLDLDLDAVELVERRLDELRDHLLAGLGQERRRHRAGLGDDLVEQRL